MYLRGDSGGYGLAHREAVGKRMVRDLREACASLWPLPFILLLCVSARGGRGSTGGRRLGALESEVFGEPHGKGALARALHRYLWQRAVLGNRDVSGCMGSAIDHAE